MSIYLSPQVRVTTLPPSPHCLAPFFHTLKHIKLILAPGLFTLGFFCQGCSDRRYCHVTLSLHASLSSSVIASLATLSKTAHPSPPIPLHCFNFLLTALSHSLILYRVYCLSTPILEFNWRESRHRVHLVHCYAHNGST